MAFLVMDEGINNAIGNIIRTTSKKAGNLLANQLDRNLYNSIAMDDLDKAVPIMVVANKKNITGDRKPENISCKFTAGKYISKRTRIINDEATGEVISILNKTIVVIIMTTARQLRGIQSARIFKTSNAILTAFFNFIVPYLPVVMVM
ncbi:hypothetical protein Desku_3244 [Desulfofundulus kuznetsovii DSM 6115]|uniref:Uncharacterized protein n=1 Tax=Desulfofundulus kuznetsovii (strain DSM 6115 / VKM B-1805 / 17) TaxID=760568 RepID=A0AAU8Q1R5_DESK7|nr:hypothetical protein Desku_3244 [Desulfofundulus kuznetsovii DSM 6115]